jgi:hypothetical protein
MLGTVPNSISPETGFGAQSSLPNTHILSTLNQFQDHQLYQTNTQTIKMPDTTHETLMMEKCLKESIIGTPLPTIPHRTRTTNTNPRARESRLQLQVRHRPCLERCPGEVGQLHGQAARVSRQAWQDQAYGCDCERCEVLGENGA